jgi:hypothetical protein
VHVTEDGNIMLIDNFDKSFLYPNSMFLTQNYIQERLYVGNSGLQDPRTGKNAPWANAKLNRQAWCAGMCDGRPGTHWAQRSAAQQAATRRDAHPPMVFPRLPFVRRLCSWCDKDTESIIAGRCMLVHARPLLPYDYRCHMSSPRSSSFPPAVQQCLVCLPAQNKAHRSHESICFAFPPRCMSCRRLFEKPSFTP